MNNEEAIKYLKQIYPYGGHCWLDEQRTEAPQYMPRPMTEEEELDAMLYDIFGFDWWKE